ncbi:hypothetical protein [Gilvimarinus xylanilyticus]|uniref:Uncharacterized protein n=1 Tax=Gilvimarinus xylanilyticus TaxID=2944139 RepID=A0A9X2HW11_9GAMM|nr:hypothetical protein [Gilvimarinus xylanilyticus]MCP8898044.1 hypothetical protein [Gilvimarinus xylanilyticus]
MQFKTLALVTAMVVSAPAWAQGTQEDLQEAQRLLQAGEYAESLEAHQTFFEQSKRVDSMTGVRLSFALSSWAELGKVYPPAQAALQSLADGLKQQLWNGEGDFDVMADYSSINTYLGESQATVKVFRHVAQEYPEQADRQFIAVRDELFAAQEYELIARFLDDPVFAFEQARNDRERDLSYVRTGHRYQPDIFSTNQKYSQKIHELLQMTESLGMTEAYSEIQKRHKAYMALQN